MRLVEKGDSSIISKGSMVNKAFSLSNKAAVINFETLWEYSSLSTSVNKCGCVRDSPPKSMVEVLIENLAVDPVADGMLSFLCIAHSTLCRESTAL